MFDEIGSKIMALAKILCFIGIAASVIVGIAIVNKDLAQALTIIGAGSVGSWVGTFLLYGFGELIDNVGLIKTELQAIRKKISPNSVNNIVSDPFAPVNTYDIKQPQSEKATDSSLPTEWK